jgi:TonB family protein
MSGGPSAAPPPPGIAPPPGFGGPPPSQPLLGGESIDELGGARSVEVAAMLGGSVVGVKHVSNPRGGKIQPATYGMLGGGVALLVLALVAFIIAVTNTAFNKAALDAWLAANNPYHEFRPDRLSLIWDWIAFGGLIAGVVCVIGALLRWREERVQPYCRIGSANDVDFALTGAPAESFPLVAPSGDDFVFNFGPGMDGEMTVEGRAIPLGELQGQGRARPSASAPGATEVPLPDGAKIHVTAGKTTFLVSSVPKPKRHPVPLFASMERSLVAFLGGTALAIGVLLLLINSIPPDPRSLALGFDADRDRLSSVQTSALEDPLQEEDEDDGDEASGGDGTAMALDEGLMGEEQSERETGQYAIEDRGADEPQISREEAIEEARETGIAGILRAREGDAFASLTGTGDFSSGFDDRDVTGGLLGDEVGTMRGGFGFGTAGVGPGGGGTGWGTIGSGRYGTIGHGSGTGSGYGAGSGAGGMRSRESRPPEVRIGTATATGELDANIIRRYIRQRLPRIRHCYERELLVKDGLRGTIVTQFQISPNGSVLSISATGMGDKNVEDCVAEAIRTIQFPAPKGGGLVNVRYPFTFQPSG